MKIKKKKMFFVFFWGGGGWGQGEGRLEESGWMGTEK